MASAQSPNRGKAFVQVLACVLSRLVAANDQQPDISGVVTKFHALRPPSISIKDYLERVNKYAACSPECFVLALIYIDRLIARNHLALTSLNVHRIIITAVMLAAKFFDDQYYNNAYYAKVGGVPCNEVNSLELEFLFSINFSLGVPTDVYERYYVELASHAGIGVGAAAASPATAGCDCVAAVGPCQGGPDVAEGGSMGFAPEDVRYTGMRSPGDLFAAALGGAGGRGTQLAREGLLGGGGGGSSFRLGAAPDEAMSSA